MLFIKQSIKRLTCINLTRNNITYPIRTFASGSKNKSVVVLNESLPLVHGGELNDLQITWEQWGDPSLPGERTVVIFPSFSHSTHVASNLADPSPGWWQGIVGPGKAINTSYFRVICPSVLGSPYGSSSPLTNDRSTGKQYKSTFPQITPADMALCHSKLLDHIGIDNVHAVVGGSLGGMQVLEFAAQFPKRMDRILILSSTAKTTPGTVALRRVQRRAILTDPNYNNGFYDENNKPINGMMTARELGMTCYRSREEFDDRFSWDPQGKPHFQHGTFEVESYMEYQAKKFAAIFDPNCYLLLSKAMDLMDLGHNQTSLAAGIGRIICDSLVVGVQQDMLTPLSEQKYLVDTLKSFERNSSLHTINSKYGHDAMFQPQMQINVFAEIIKEFIEKGYEDNLEHEKHRYSSL